MASKPKISRYTDGVWKEVANFGDFLTAEDKQTLNDAISKKLDSNGHIAAFAKELPSLQGIPNWATGTVSGLTTYVLTSLHAESHSGTVAINSVTSTSGRYYKIEYDKDGNLMVNVPWTSTVSAATSSSYGGIKTGYAESGKYYAVKLDSSGKAYVYVPWSASSFTGSMGSNTLDLSSSSNGIKFGSGWYVTNIETGVVQASIGKTTNSETTVSVSFHNGSKGSGKWHVFCLATDKTTNSGWGSSVVCAPLLNVAATSSSELPYISESGFKISCRRVYGANVSYNSTEFVIYWLAVKYF